MLGEKISELRKARGLSQYQLADKLGFSRGKLSNYEQGSRQPDYETLKTLAEFFDVSTDYLLGRSEDKKPIHIAFSHGDDPLTEEEEAFLERQLEEFRNLRKKFEQQDK
ncbi:helix-turn-helix transcriptional regulator [Bacillus sp. YZJH907-2]|uniref:Helix-turn-helix transcriptional regulator n=1 Tax=Halalkalibacter suaedae TaxID=2822140 RepID=A0A941AN19_9BACI|nr:helix-turn-helix transcriptional regulator [Bacillus suaedae]MBP3951160.1 helix-turn-helix transcriptional regulator [Bacillus suaedae]